MQVAEWKENKRPGPVMEFSRHRLRTGRKPAAWAHTIPMCYFIEILRQKLHCGNTGPILAGKVRQGGQFSAELSDLPLLFSK